VTTATELNGSKIIFSVKAAKTARRVKTMNLFLSIVSKLFAVLPLVSSIIQHVEQTKSAASGTEKLSTATSLLHDAAGIASTISPGNAEAASAAAGAAQAVVQGVFDVMKATGALTEVKKPTPPAPANVLTFPGATASPEPQTPATANASAVNLPPAEAPESHPAFTGKFDGNGNPIYGAA
jgi:hypothetical protein